MNGAVGGTADGIFDGAERMAQRAEQRIVRYMLGGWGGRTDGGREDSTADGEH